MSTSGRDAFRSTLAQREAPRALLWTGLVIGALSVLNAIIDSGRVAFADALHAGVVAVFLVGAWLTSRARVPAPAAPWIVAACGATFVLSVQLEVVVDPTALGLAYVLMGMLGFGAFTLDVRAMVTAAAVMMVGFVFAARAWDPADWTTWCAAALAALLMGGVLLRLRLSAIDALGALTDRTRELATRDALTEVFNRRGVEERVGEVVAAAARQDKRVFAVFVDIDGLKAANDTHGHEFGDQVIRAVANSVRATVRASDIIGRWGGDEFIVLGIGMPAALESLAERLQAQLSASGIDLERWGGGVSLGAATAAPADLDFDDLVRRADADMYARRRVQRES
jgi:diguanylate cyclase (GGDEF)-like protein